MVLLALLLVATGLGVAGFGIAQQRSTVPSGAVAAVTAEEDTGPAASVVTRALEPLLDAGSRLVRRLSPVRRLELIRRRIVWAGLEGTVTLEKMLSYKAAATVVGVLMGLATGGIGGLPTLVVALLVGGAASIVPDVVLSSRATERQKQVAVALPEALDLLALTVEAGLSLEQALEVVCDTTVGPLSAEFNRLLREVELGVPRRDALIDLRERTDVPEMSSFVVALVQSETMGVSLGDVLKVQAVQVRLKRRQRAREQAAKTPVKILFPLVIGIFPTLFVVTIGPGAIKIYQSFVK